MTTSHILVILVASFVYAVCGLALLGLAAMVFATAYKMALWTRDRYLWLRWFMERM
jgi:hypothetical protein